MKRQQLTSALHFLRTCAGILLLVLVAAQWAIGQSSAPLRDKSPLSLKVSSHHDHPTQCNAFLWSQYMRWDTSWQQNYTYAPSGLLLTTTQSDYVGGASVYALSEQHVYVYDSNGRKLDHILLSWNGSAYENNSRETWIRDARGNDTLYFQFLWRTDVNGSDWDTLLGNRQRYQYISSGDIESVEMATWAPQGVWSNATKTVYHFTPALVPDTVTYFTAISGNWQPNGRKVDMTWANYSLGQIATATTQLPNGGWTNVQRLSCSYTGLDSDCSTESYLGGWDSVSREYRYYDADSHLTKVENWIRQNSLWSQQSGQTHDYTYDGLHHVSERLDKDWDIKLGYSNTARYEYAGFVTDAEEAVEIDLHVVAYPNPVSDMLNLDIARPERGPLEFTLYDLQGRVRMRVTTHFQGNPIRLPIHSGLENGRYLYRMTTKSGAATGQILIQH